MKTFFHLLFSITIHCNNSNIKIIIEDNRQKIEAVLKAFDQRDEDAIDIVDLGHVFRCMRVDVSQAEIYDIEAQVAL